MVSAHAADEKPNIPKASETIAETLTNYDYKTSAFGKWHNSPTAQTTRSDPPFPPSSPPRRWLPPSPPAAPNFSQGLMIDEESFRTRLDPMSEVTNQKNDNQPRTNE